MTDYCIAYMYRDKEEFHNEEIRATVSDSLTAELGRTLIKLLREDPGILYKVILEGPIYDLKFVEQCHDFKMVETFLLGVEPYEN